MTRADGTVTATWPAVSEADGYHVGSSPNLGESWHREATDYTDTTITFSADNDLTYMVSVMSVNGGGESEWLDSAPALPYEAPPARPTGLTAAAGDESVDLAWNDPSDTSITGYEYRMRAAPPAPGWGSWTAIPGSGADTTSYTVEGLTNGTEYRFKLRAVDDAGESPPAPDTDPWYAAATPAIQPPGQPTGVTATENNGNVTITWNPPNDASITGYQIQQKQQGGAWGAQTPIGGGAGTTSHQTGQLPGGNTYQFNLQALNAGGASRGTQVSVHVPATLAGPENLTITARSAGTLTATWTAVPGGWRYYIYTATSGDNWTNYTTEPSVTGTSVTLSNRNDAHNYIVRIWASTDYGHTLRVESYPAGTLTSPPIPPESVSLSRSGTTLTASWPAVVGAANYNVDLSSDGGSTWAGQATAITTTSWTKSSIDANTSYAVRVQTKNNAGTSAWTASSVSTPAPPAPDSVTLGTRTADTLNVSWSAVANATSYNVRTSTDSGLTWGAASSETGTTTALTVDGSSDYAVGVQAVNSAGTSGWTVSSISYAIPLPPAPANLAATRGKGSITLTWDTAAGADTYDLACSTFGGNPGLWEVCKTGMTDANRSATITQMYNKTAGRMSAIYDKRDYVFAVRGKNTSGNGEWTRMTVWPAMPEQIASIAAARTADDITLTMTVPPANGGYAITRMHVDCRTSSNGGTTWSGWFACTDAQTQDPVSGTTFTAVVNNIDNYDSTLTYQARARAANGLGAAWDWQVSAVIAPLPATLTAGSIAATTATLTIAHHSGNWHYQADTGPDSTCQGPVSGTTENLTGLSAGTTYTYKAYSDSACTTGNLLATAAAFSTPASLTASAVTTTSATLTLAGHTGNWWLKKTAPAPAGSCTAGEADFSHALSSQSFTIGTAYTYKAYSASTCADANEIASETFTPGVITSNLGETGGATQAMGSAGASKPRVAQAFTTGSNTGGYSLHSVTATFGNDAGSPGNISVAIHAADTGNSSNPASTATITLTGSNPATAGNYAYTCSGACSLSANTTYFVVLSVPNASGWNYYRARLTGSNNETNSPSNNGWSIANEARVNTGSAWIANSNALMLQVAATAP